MVILIVVGLIIGAVGISFLTSGLEYDAEIKDIMLSVFLIMIGIGLIATPFFIPANEKIETEIYISSKMEDSSIKFSKPMLIKKTAYRHNFWSTACVNDKIVYEVSEVKEE